MSGEAILSLENTERHYHGGDNVVRALDGVTLQIHAGEFVAIMGQSGSGKSTLMNIMGCLDRPSGGSYKVRGRDVSKLTPDELAALRRETFGFIFQRYNLLNTSSAVENVEIPAMYAGMPRRARQKRAHELLERLGLGSRADHRPAQLSGGQQQRVAIARALMNDPPVILADEPTGALDSRSGQDVMALLRDLNAEGRTIILITHDENVAKQARRIIRISDGRITDDSGVDTQGRKSAENPSPSRGHAHAGTEGAEAVRTALRALRVNKFRTALTLLGIVIGVAAVITMLAVGNGSKQKVLNQITALGTNLLNIRPGAPGIRSSGDIATLVLEDAKAIEELPNIDVVVPGRGGRKTLRLGNTDYATAVDGVGPGFPRARDWPIEKGSFFTVRDMESYAPVIVIGKTVEKIFFPGGEDPVGKYIQVGNIPFLVVGVMSSKGAAPWGGDLDDRSYVPLTTALIRLYGGNYLTEISVKATNSDIIAQTEESIRKLLISRHRTEDFFVRNSASFLQTATQTQNTLTILLGTVAAISLLVGGIGVMNIMLVSVTERTREIGVRMATGARMKDILIQFNTEAAVVCTIGGILGVITGLGAGKIISLFEVDVVFTLMPVVVAFSCAVGTGLFFGYLPARKAARLDPVVALSSE